MKIREQKEVSILDKTEETQSIVWRIISNMAENIDTKGRLSMFNERYLHHYFSKGIQSNNIHLDICGKDIMLFPEWPTYKEGNGNVNNHKFAKYKKELNGYEPKDINEKEGSAGFIDFAIIGSYNAPKIGVEFKYLTSWNKDAITFDFLKLMDKRNPFEVAIWFGLINRENEFSNKLSEKNFNDALTEAEKRLNEINSKPENNKKNRKMFILATEIACNQNNKRRHWFCGKDKIFKKIKTDKLASVDSFNPMLI